MNDDFSYIALLANPKAGSGRGIHFLNKLMKELDGRNMRYAVFIGDWPEELSAYSDAWVVGGDGTLNTFINRFPACSLPITLFPGGSGNDYHWLLYGDLSLDELLQIALNGKLNRMDAGICNDKLFMNGIGIGFDGSIARALMKKNKKPGIASYWSAVIKQLFFYREKSYLVQSVEHVFKGSFLLIDCMNGRRSGGGFMVTPQAVPDDGYFDIMLSSSLHWWKRLLYLPVIQNGKHTHLPFVTCYRTKEITITCSRPMEAHLDGEYMEGNEFLIKLLPRQFLFRVP